MTTRIKVLKWLLTSGAFSPGRCLAGLLDLIYVKKIGKEIKIHYKAGLTGTGS